MLFAVRCSLHLYVLSVVCCLLRVVRCWQFVVCCLCAVFVVCYVLFVVSCSWRAVRCLLFVVCFVVDCCLLFVVCDVCFLFAM